MPCAALLRVAGAGPDRSQGSSYDCSGRGAQSSTRRRRLSPGTARHCGLRRSRLSHGSRHEVPTCPPTAEVSGPPSCLRAAHHSCPARPERARIGARHHDRAAVARRQRDRDRHVEVPDRVDLRSRHLLHLRGDGNHASRRHPDGSQPAEAGHPRVRYGLRRLQRRPLTDYSGSAMTRFPAVRRPAPRDRRGGPRPRRSATTYTWLRTAWPSPAAVANDPVHGRPPHGRRRRTPPSRRTSSARPPPGSPRPRRRTRRPGTWSRSATVPATPLEGRQRARRRGSPHPRHPDAFSDTCSAGSPPRSSGCGTMSPATARPGTPTPSPDSMSASACLFG